MYYNWLFTGLMFGFIALGCGVEFLIRDIWDFKCGYMSTFWLCAIGFFDVVFTLAGICMVSLFTFGIIISLIYF